MCVVGGALSPINLGILRVNPKPSGVTGEQRFWCAVEIWNYNVSPKNLPFLKILHIYGKLLEV